MKNGNVKNFYSKCVINKYEMSTNVYVNVSKKNRLVKFTRKKNRLVSLSTFLLPLGVRLVILNLNFTTEEVI